MPERKGCAYVPQASNLIFRGQRLSSLAGTQEGRWQLDVLAVDPARLYVYSLPNRPHDNTVAQFAAAAAWAVVSSSDRTAQMHSWVIHRAMVTACQSQASVSLSVALTLEGHLDPQSHVQDRRPQRAPAGARKQPRTGQEPCQPGDEGGEAHRRHEERGHPVAQSLPGASAPPLIAACRSVSGSDTVGQVCWHCRTSQHHLIDTRALCTARRDWDRHQQHLQHCWQRLLAKSSDPS